MLNDLASTFVASGASPEVLYIHFFGRKHESVQEIRRIHSALGQQMAQTRRESRAGEMVCISVSP